MLRGEIPSHRRRITQPRRFQDDDAKRTAQPGRQIRPELGAQRIGRQNDQGIPVPLITVHDRDILNRHRVEIRRQVFGVEANSERIGRGRRRPSEVQKSGRDKNPKTSKRDGAHDVRIYTTDHHLCQAKPGDVLVVCEMSA